LQLKKVRIKVILTL